MTATVKLHDYRLPVSEADDNMALARAKADTRIDGDGMNKGAEIVAVGGRGALPGGAYGVSSWSANGIVPVGWQPGMPIQPNPNEAGNLWSGMKLRGEGDATVFRKEYFDKPYHFLLEAPRGPADEHGVDTQTGVGKDIELSDFAIEDDVETLGHNEQFCMVSINGADGFKAARITTRGGRGDDWTVGSGVRNPALYHRHNRGIELADLTGDGVTGQGRQFLSIIDAVGLKAKNLTARNYTNPGDPARGINPMPGTIDIEPHPTSRDPHVQDIEIDGLDTADCGGAALALLLRNNDQIPSPIRGIVARNITALRCRTGQALLHGGGTDMATPWDIQISGGSAIDCPSLGLTSGKGVTIENMDYSRSLPGYVGVPGTGWTVYDLILRDILGGELDVYGWERGRLEYSALLHLVGQPREVIVVRDRPVPPPAPEPLPAPAPEPAPQPEPDPVPDPPTPSPIPVPSSKAGCMGLVVALALVPAVLAVVAR